MAHSYHHAVSSARKWGGAAEDYLAIHTWFDRSKEIVADFRHRALRHHAEGIFPAVIWTDSARERFRRSLDDECDWAGGLPCRTIL